MKKLSLQALHRYPPGIRVEVTGNLVDFCVCENGEWDILWLEADQVSLPPKSLAGNVDMLSIFPRQVRERYEFISSLLKQPMGPREPNWRPFLGVKKGEYYKLLETVVNVRNVRLQRKKPRVTKGAFAVLKDLLRLLIIDTRPASETLQAPRKVVLPTPNYLARLMVAGDCELVVGKSDLGNF